MEKKLFLKIPVIKGERITLKALTRQDAGGLHELTECEKVYRYLPTFLFERQFDNAEDAIEKLYAEYMKQSLILGAFIDDLFCGLAEFYGYDKTPWKVSVGNRFLPQYWGQGVATETIGLMVQYLLNETDVKILTASTMIKNKASETVLKKNGFKCVAHGVLENWGYTTPTMTDKWVKTAAGYHLPYRFHT